MKEKIKVKYENGKEGNEVRTGKNGKNIQKKCWKVEKVECGMER